MPLSQPVAGSAPMKQKRPRHACSVSPARPALLPQEASHDLEERFVVIDDQ
jgi:hypothetical protein